MTADFGFDSPQLGGSKTACPHCGSPERISAISIHQTTTEPGVVGLAYKAWKFLRNAEPLLADLCPKCGTLTRIYVKELNRPWIQETTPQKR